MESRRFMASGSAGPAYYYSVWLILVLFLVVRVMHALNLDGSYVDEYLHFIVGNSLLSGDGVPTFYVHGEPYLRGLFVSVWAGIWGPLLDWDPTAIRLTLFPLSVGCFFLLWSIANRVLAAPFYVCLALLLYAINPFSVFSHEFTRFYLWYELFVLAQVFCFIRIIEIAEDEHSSNRSLLLYIVLVLGINLFNWFLSHDHGMYVVALAGVSGAAYLWLFHTKLLARWPTLSPLSSGAVRTGVLIVMAALGAWLLDLPNEWRTLAEGTSTGGRGWIVGFFLDRSTIITWFFLLSCAAWFWVRDHRVNLVLTVAGALFLLHVASPNDTQAFRIIAYFIPLYIVVALVSASRVRFELQWLYNIAVAGIFLLTFLNQYPRDYAETRQLANDVNVYGLGKLYTEVLERCEDDIVAVASTQAHIAAFHGIDVDFTLMTEDNAREGPRFEMADGAYRSVLDGKPVIHSLDDLIRQETNFCVVGTQRIAGYISRRDLEYLEENAQVTQFRNLTLYELE